MYCLQLSVHIFSPTWIWFLIWSPYIPNLANGFSSPLCYPPPPPHPPVVAVRSLINPSPGCRAGVMPCLAASYIVPPSPWFGYRPSHACCSNPWHRISCPARPQRGKAFSAMIQMYCDKDLMHRWETPLCFCGVAPWLLCLCFLLLPLFICLYSKLVVSLHDHNLIQYMRNIDFVFRICPAMFLKWLQQTMRSSN